VLLSYFRTAYRNPGFITPASDVISADNNVDATLSKGHPKYLSTENDDPSLVASKSQKPSTEKQKIIPDCEEIIVFEARFCTVCCLEQPMRSKHCRECGHCVALHDHHCPWLGLCIGEKNRFYFWWYLFFECALLWESAVLVVASIEDRNGLDWASANWGRVALMVVLSFFILMVSCLLGYHSYLAATNQTTWENVSWDKISYLKQRSRKMGSPFSKGLLFNLWFYCWKKTPENYTVWNVTRPRSVSPTV
jgi:palmitoyltransferase